MTGLSLQTRALQAGYQKKKSHASKITDALELALCPGQLVCLIGPNGCGKSTLIKTLGGMLKPLAGQVIIDGHELKAHHPQQRARFLAMVLTDRIDFGLLKVHEVVSFGRMPYNNWWGTLSADDHQHINQALKDCGLEKLRDRPMVELSDGQRQRAMIARVLAQDTPLILLDEPTAFLDVGGRAELMVLLQKLAHQHGRSIVMSTHDLELALAFADELWLMPGDRSLLSGLPEELASQGQLDRMLNTEALFFDPKSGRLKMKQPSSQKRVHVFGSGQALFWTKALCQRLHLDLAEQSHDAEWTIEVMLDQDQFHWNIRHQEGEGLTCDSWQTLTAGIRQKVLSDG